MKYILWIKHDKQLYILKTKLNKIYNLRTKDEEKKVNQELNIKNS